MEPVDVLAQVAIISAVIAKVVERVRAHWSIDGDLVTLVAWVVGTAVAWGLGLDVSAQLTRVELADPLAYVVSGLAVGLGAGVVADVTGRSD